MTVEELPPSVFSEKVDGVDIVFKRLGDRKPGQSWILLIYGASGTGKTWFCGTAGEKTLFLNIGNGMETLSSPLFLSKYPSAKDIIYVDITARMAGEVAADKAFDIITDAIDVALAKHADKFDTIVLDDATYLRKMAMNKAMTLNTAARTNKTGRYDPTESFVSADVQDYKVEMNMIEWFLATYTPKLREANKHFVMTAHERMTFGKAPKIGDDAPLLRVMPGFTGKTFPDVIPAYFDDVFRTEVVGSEMNRVYRFSTAGNEMQSGKSRHAGVFENVEKSPEFRKLLARIQNAQLITRK